MRVRPRIPFYQKILHIFLLSGLLFAQPLLDLIGANVEFLVARQAGRNDIYMLLVVLCLVVPGAIAIIELIARIFGQRVSDIVHSCLIFVLSSSLYLISLNLLSDISGISSIVLAVFAGSITTFCYLKYSVIRTYFNFLSPVILIIPIYFLLNPQVSKLTLTAGEDKESTALGTSTDTPIVLLIFDEFPVISLLDENGEIDPIRYPNFASLANDAIWFRNAQTVSGATLESVSAILSGLQPKPDLLPIQKDFPQTLFTLFENDHKLEVFETVTSLCPDLSCGGDIVEPTIESLQTSVSELFKDILVVYLHLLIPEDFAGRLPVISQTWKDFNNHQPEGKPESKRRAYTKVTRPEGFANFLNKMSDSEKPGFYFYHTILPHVPWRFLPSGKVYKHHNVIDIPGLELLKEQWGDNDGLVTLGQQRHLLQVGYTDKLIGDLVGRLKEQNIYDKSLIIVTSDHGASFWPNSSRRARGFSKPGTLKDVFGIPLIMKMPNQQQGQVSDDPVRSIDIVPTIGLILGIEIPWKTDGKAVITSASKSASKSNVNHPYFDNIGLKRKLRIFGSGITKPDGLYQIGAHQELIGRQIMDMEFNDNGEISVSIDQSEYLSSVDFSESYIPAYITGDIVNEESHHEATPLAIAVNGTISAVTTSYLTKDGHQFSVIIPENSLQEGNNLVSIYSINEINGSPFLSKLNLRDMDSQE
ncbi:MAG: sulfatase-like hydrolase/transferase [Xanthomonadales bacterium]|nr:sulfatase-like hydrolase/transferase [Xanthomonadales bacterium]